MREHTQNTGLQLCVQLFDRFTVNALLLCFANVIGLSATIQYSNGLWLFT